MTGALPTRIHLEAAAHAAGVPHRGLSDLDLLTALLSADAYPHLYRLPAGAQPPYDGWVSGWLLVEVRCAECVARRYLSAASPVYVEKTRLGSHTAVHCPRCGSLLHLPLRGLPVWRWRWYEEAQSAHVTYRLGTQVAPAPSYWVPGLWGTPIPAAAPPPPPPLPTRVMERAMPPRLHQAVTYHLSGMGLLGHLAEGQPDADGYREVVVALPIDPAEREAVLREIVVLTGGRVEDYPPEEWARLLGMTALHLSAAEGMEAGCWWPRAEAAVAEPTSVLPLLDLEIAEGIEAPTVVEGEE